MKISEIEVYNYKCLNNWGYPIKLDNLNVLIGENDSGKTSFLEAIEILFGEIEVKNEMFFNPEKEIKVKVKLNDIEKEILEEALMLQEWGITYYKYFQNISGKLRFYDEAETYDRHFPEYVEYLKDFNFYNDILKLYKSFLKDLCITLEIEYRFEDDELILKKEVYFNADYKVRKIQDKLLSDPKFTEFMENYLSKFDKNFDLMIKEMKKDLESERFSFRSESDFYILDSILSGQIKDYKSGPEDFLDYIRKHYSQKIFDNDDNEIILSKIAKTLTVLINKRVNEKCTWDTDYLINLSVIEKEPLESTWVYAIRDEHEDKKTSEQLKDIYYMSGVNLFGNFLCEEYAYLYRLPLPRIYKFSMEVVNEEIPKVLMDYIFGGKDVLKNFIYRDFCQLFLDVYREQKILDRYFDSKDLEEEHPSKKIQKIIKTYLNVLGENISELDIDFHLNDVERVREVLDPSIDIYVTDNNKKINIIQKGQGFLRKLLLANFLMLVEDFDKVFKKEKDENNIARNKIIMVEEPELHLHSSAQRDIMKILRDTLKSSANQIFITTHSHYIIKETDFKDMFVLKKNKELGISSISNCKQHKERLTILKDLQESLGLEKTDLLYIVNLIILVEGKRDKIFFEALSKRPDINLNLEKVKIVQVDGQDKMDYYVKSDLISEFLGIKLLIILDNNRKNLKRKRNLIKNKKIEESNVIIIGKNDIMNYLDNRKVELHYGLNTDSLKYDSENEKLENVLEKDLDLRITENDIEEIILKMDKIPSPIIKIIEQLNFFINL